MLSWINLTGQINSDYLISHIVFIHPKDRIEPKWTLYYYTITTYYRSIWNEESILQTMQRFYLINLELKLRQWMSPLLLVVAPNWKWESFQNPEWLSGLSGLSGIQLPISHKTVFLSRVVSFARPDLLYSPRRFPAVSLLTIHAIPWSASNTFVVVGVAIVLPMLNRSILNKVSWTKIRNTRLAWEWETRCWFRINK